MSWSYSYIIPTAPSPASGTFTTTFTTGSGGGVVDLNGVGYGELLNSQTGESLSINSITIQPYASGTFSLNERISQLLQPMTFRKHLAWGTDRVFVLNPIVDANQESTTLKHVNLGKRRDEFIFDGTTRFSYQLLPYAVVNVQFEYTKITNFVMGNPALVKEIVKLNKERNQKEEYLSGIAKQYTLNKKDAELLKGKNKKKSKTIIDFLLNR
jgi:hypothetical protein